MPKTEMTLYELTKKYGEGKGPDMMWSTLRTVSDAVEDSMAEKPRAALMRDLYRQMSGGHYNEEFATEAVARLYYVDASGQEHRAPYWTPQAVAPIYEKVKADIPKYNAWDFYVTLNMIASDNWLLVERWFPGLPAEQRDQRFIELAVNWLRDPDAKGDNKIWDYLER